MSFRLVRNLSLSLRPFIREGSFFLSFPRRRESIFQSRGIEPEHPFKGSFNVRVGSNLHQKIALEGMKKGVSLNKYIVDVLEKETGKRRTA